MAIWKKPWEWRTWPVPWHWGQVSGLLPGAAPLPEQSGQVTCLGRVRGISSPVAACSNVTFRL